MRFWGSTLARNIPAALDIYADIILRPHLPERGTRTGQALVDPGHPEPGRRTATEGDGRASPPLLPAAALQGPPRHDRGHRGSDARRGAEQYRRLFRPNGAILSVAGNIEWEPLKAQVERLFQLWKPTTDPDLTPQAHAPSRSTSSKDTQQTQIAFAFASAPVGPPGLLRRPRGRGRALRAA